MTPPPTPMASSKWMKRRPMKNSPDRGVLFYAREGEVNTWFGGRMVALKSTRRDLECLPVSGPLQNHSWMRSCAFLLCIALTRPRGNRSVDPLAQDNLAGWALPQLHRGTRCKSLTFPHPFQRCREHKRTAEQPDKVQLQKYWFFS